MLSQKRNNLQGICLQMCRIYLVGRKIYFGKKNLWKYLPFFDVNYLHCKNTDFSLFQFLLNNLKMHSIKLAIDN